MTDTYHEPATAWTVERYGDRKGEKERVLFSGSEVEARAQFLVHLKDLRFGSLRLRDPAGRTILYEGRRG